MMLSRPPGPRSTLRFYLLMAISDGCNEIRFRRAGGGYDMWWVIGGAQYDAVPPLPGYVRRFADILWLFAHGRPGLAHRVERFARRLGTATEGGAFDFPVGTEFVIEASYRAVWRRGRVKELGITLGESAALSTSGIAKQECDLAWYGPLGE